MKYIIKRSEPIEFTNWLALVNDDWQPTYDKLSGSVKKAVKNALMQEQGYICCYCEQRIIDSDSHIEHFQPQHDPSVNPLDYNNLLCSCQNKIQKGDPRHCGNLKGDWFDSALIISPMGENCQSRFHFNGDGSIRASGDRDLAATTTIDKLGLNQPYFNNLRNQTIEPFLADDLTPEELEKFIYGYLEKDSQGKFGEFWTTIEQLFRSK